MRHSVNGDGGCCGRMASHRHAVAVAVMTVIRRGALIGGEFTTTDIAVRRLSAKVKESQSVTQEGVSTQFISQQYPNLAMSLEQKEIALLES